MSKNFGKVIVRLLKNKEPLQIFEAALLQNRLPLFDAIEIYGMVNSGVIPNMHQNE